MWWEVGPEIHHRYCLCLQSMAFMTNKEARNTENKEEICPEILKPLISAALQTEAQQACGCEERAWVSNPSSNPTILLPEKHRPGLGDLNGEDRTQLSAEFQALMSFPPSFLVQLLRVTRPACSHIDITPGQQEDKQTG